MVLLTFSVLYDRLMDQTKTQTIRKIGVSPTLLSETKNTISNYRIQKGSKLHLWWLNPRNRHPDCYKMGEGICVSLEACEFYPDNLVLYNENLFDEFLNEQTSAKAYTRYHSFPSESPKIAKRDGFNDYSAMYNWFFGHYAGFEGQPLDKILFAIIQWQWTDGPHGRK